MSDEEDEDIVYPNIIVSPCQKINEYDPYYEWLFEFYYRWDIAGDPDIGIMRGYRLTNIVERLPDTFIWNIATFFTHVDPSVEIQKKDALQRMIWCQIADQTNLDFRKLFSFLEEHLEDPKKYIGTPLHAGLLKRTPFLCLIIEIMSKYLCTNYRYYEKQKLEFLYETKEIHTYRNKYLSYKVDINNSTFAQRLRKHTLTLFSGF
jgi:hypothetical protein